jgi:hypothetical protein
MFGGAPYGLAAPIGIATATATARSFTAKDAKDPKDTLGQLRTEQFFGNTSGRSCLEEHPEAVDSSIRLVEVPS